MRYLEMARKHNLMMWMPVEEFSKANLTGIKGALITGGRESEWMVKSFFTRAPGDERLIKDFTPREKSRIFAAAYEANVERMIQGVRAIKDMDNLLSYANFDEPFGPRHFDQWVQGLDLYKRVNQEDGYHPMSVLAGPPEFDFCDIIGMDPYWIPGAAGDRDGPLYVVEMCAMFEKRARPLRKPLWMVPVGENWSGMRMRFIIPREQYCQTYLMLIHGARALIYFCYPFMHQASFEALGTLAKQMQTLGPACVAPDVPQAITYSPGEMDFENKKYPDVHVKLISNPKGGFILLAANGRNYPVDVEYTLSLLGRSGKVKRLFTDDTCRVKDGRFKDKLENYGVRAYEIRSQESEVRSQNESAIGNRQSAIQIAVAMTPHPELEVREEEIPRSGRSGKKNIMPNPSMEENNLPGWPDYYRPVYMPTWPRIGQEGALWGLDADKPYHGKVSMRISKGRALVCYLAPKVEKKTTFVLSAYMRANTNGVATTFLNAAWGAPAGMGQKRFDLTAKWERFSETFEVQPLASPYSMIGIMAPTNGVMWVDALQVESGEEPTEFEP